MKYLRLLLSPEAEQPAGEKPLEDQPPELTKPDSVSSGSSSEREISPEPPSSVGFVRSSERGIRQPSPAQALLDHLLDLGCTFSLMGQDLIWFGPASSVTPEVRIQITRLKPGIISLLREGYPRARRAWGEPTPENWQDHPRKTIDTDRSGSVDAEEAGGHSPWPDSLPGLGRRTLNAFGPCADCQDWSWVRFGQIELCFGCAWRRAGGPL
jgi:hypothetical protein